MKTAPRVVKAGRPLGSQTFDPVVAAAFGAAMRSARLARGLAQEQLAEDSGVERSHLGKVERGEHMPNLGMILRIAAALNCRAGDLLDATESALEVRGWTGKPVV